MRPITDLLADLTPRSATEAFWLTGWQVAQTTTDTMVRAILRGSQDEPVLLPHQLRRLLLYLTPDISAHVMPYWDMTAATYVPKAADPVTDWDKAVASFWAGYGYARGTQ